MSQTTPNWYPDPSGQYAQRYHDGTSWTDHVMDAAGNRSTAPAEAAAPVGAQGHQQPGHPQQQGYGHAGGYGEQSGPAAGGITPTIGLVVAAVGALLVLLSVFSMDFVSFSDDVGSIDFSFGDLRDLESEGAIELDGRTGLYITVPYLFALVVIVASVLAALRLPQLAQYNDRLPRGASIASGLILVYHLMAAFSWDLGPGGGSAAPATGGWIGAVGYAGLAAAPWLAQPLGGSRTG